MIKISDYITTMLKEFRSFKHFEDGIFELDIGSDDGFWIKENSINRIKFKIGPR